MDHVLPSIATAASQLRSGASTPRALVEQCLANIDRRDDEIHAWVVVDREAALAEADRLGDLLANGESCGPLHGIPWGIKDIVDVDRMPTRCGSPLRSMEPVTADAEIVRQLRGAGAVILGKTVTTEFACFDPSPTRNPWNTAHTPGGSSSGSAAAVASGMCLAAIGSQTGGSINRPASYCGVAGFKPTFDTVSRFGVFPVSDRLDHVGPMCRTVADLEIVFRALFSGPSGVGDRYLPLRWVDDFFADNTVDSSREVNARALDVLRRAVTIDSASPLPESFSGVHEHHFRIMAVGAATVHGQQFKTQPELFGPKLASLIEAGLETSPAEYDRSMQHQESFRHDIDAYVAANGALLLPATPASAPADLGTTGDPQFNSPWSYCGLPAVNFPCGLDVAGMPCGLQIVGPRHCDHDVLGVATWCEARLTEVIDELPLGVAR